MIDLALGSTHDISIDGIDLKQIAGVDVVAQRVRVRLKMFRGEWMLDEAAGVPYYRDVFISAPKSRLVEALLRKEILSVDEIERIKTFTMTLDKTTRKLSVDFKAVSSEGIVAISEVFPP